LHGFISCQTLNDTLYTVLLYGIEKQQQPNSLTPKAVRRDEILIEAAHALAAHSLAP